MPNKGYKQRPEHRRRIAVANARHARSVREALEAFALNRSKHRHVPDPKPQPKPTPVPPSASEIRSGMPQRWGLYSFHSDGKYYYKREQADSLRALQKCIRALNLDPPYWTYVKSGRTDHELTLPIRIPEEAVKSLGHRWHHLKVKEKEKTV